MLLFHNDLFHADLSARGKAEEIDALGHVVDTDLRIARGITTGNLLTHAVEHLIAEFSIVTVNVQHVVHGVGIDCKFGSVLIDTEFIKPR